jgi:hypothetical protein
MTRDKTTAGQDGVADEISIKIIWHLAPVTNRWVAWGQGNFGWIGNCDEPLDAAQARIREELRNAR